MKKLTLLLLMPVVLFAESFSIGGQRATLEIPNSWDEVQRLSEGSEEGIIYDTGYAMISVAISPAKNYLEYGGSAWEGMLTYIMGVITYNYEWEEYGSYADFGTTSNGPYAYSDWIYYYNGYKQYGIKYIVTIDNYDLQITGMQCSVSNSSKLRNAVLKIADSISL